VGAQSPKIQTRLEGSLMKPETRILAPTRILEQAKRLYDNKQYKAALELLQRNSIEFLIHDYFIEVRAPVTPKRKYHFSK
jgi:hypothetical protein